MRLAEGLGQSASQKKTEGNVRDAEVLNLLTSGCPPQHKDSRHQPRSWQCAYPRPKDQLGAPLFEIRINGINMIRPSQRLTQVLTLFDDIVAEDTEHGTENGVVEEKKESKNSHGLLRLRGGQRV